MRNPALPLQDFYTAYESDALFIARDFYKTMGVVKHIGNQKSHLFYFSASTVVAIALSFSIDIQHIHMFIIDNHASSVLRFPDGSGEKCERWCMFNGNVIVLDNSIFLGAGKIPSVAISKSMFEQIVRDLLLVRQYRVELLVNTGKGRNNEWVVSKKV